MGCNMRCKHCGSSCMEPLPDELSTQQALSICDQIADMGLRWVTISGGEPLTRDDTPDIVRYLASKGVSVNLITNGWLLDKEYALRLKNSNISTIAISIDGTKEIHDSIRRIGSFERDEAAFHILKELGITTGAVTTISKKNLADMPALKEKLIEMGVDSWQVQLGLPMGNFKEQPDWVLSPSDVNDVIDFCYETAKEGAIRIFPADCIGYYTKKELEIKRFSYHTQTPSSWSGCNAGVRSFGLLQNGDILGCTSIRSKEYIEGNLLKRSLRDIWEDSNAFQWRRSLEKSKLGGECQSCTYGSVCLGGCPNTRLTMNGSIYSENQFCAYNLVQKSWKEKFSKEQDVLVLHQMALKLISNQNFQEASFALSRILELSQSADVYKEKAFCEYMCGNYSRCKEDNEKALDFDENDAYALKGLGIALFKLGSKEEGLSYLQKAAELTNYGDADIVNDLYVVRSSMENMQHLYV